MTTKIIKIQKILAGLFFIVVLNLVFLSISSGQSNVNVQGYVPETEFNKDFKPAASSQESEKPIFKENKYQYFFEKNWLEQKQTVNNAQSTYDQISSKALMFFLVVVFAITFWIILRFIDLYIINKIRL